MGFKSGDRRGIFFRSIRSLRRAFIALAEVRDGSLTITKIFLEQVVLPSRRNMVGNVLLMRLEK